MDREKEEPESGGQERRLAHQLWSDGCFYVGLDLPQVFGLILELLLNISVWLEIKKKKIG